MPALTVQHVDGDRFTIGIRVPHDRREALLAVASHCTVHNTVTHPPAIDIAVAESPSPAAPAIR